MAFYLNGVELDSTVQDRSGGDLELIFSTDSAGDKFLTARALYGDVEETLDLRHHSLLDILDRRKLLWRQRPLGMEKILATATLLNRSEFLPTWFNELHEHWIHPNNWARQPMWDGASPIRIENKDIYESVSIIINSNSPALEVSELLHSQSTEIIATADWAQGNVPFTVIRLYGNDQIIAEINVENNNPFSNRLQMDI